MSDGDREWYCVEDSGGTRLPVDGQSSQAANYEVALERARELAVRYDSPLTIVRFQRTELTVVGREVTIKETDVSSDTAKA